MPHARLLRLLAAAALVGGAVLAAPSAEAAGRARVRSYPVRRIAGPRFLEGDTFVARTEAEWKAAWRDSGSPGRIPPVDFSRRMVVGLHSGGVDGCHGFRLASLRVGRDAAEVLWRPSYTSGALCTAAVWTGWRYATVPRTEGPLSFRQLPTLVYFVGR